MDVPTCARCPAFLFAPESFATGLCHGCRSGPPAMILDAPAVFVPKRKEPEFQPQVAPPEFVLALAEKIHAAHEVLANLAEKKFAPSLWAQVLVAEGGCPL